MEDQYRERMLKRLHLPADVMEGAPILTMMGKNQIYLENYRGILEYDDKLVKVQTKMGVLVISGKNICIDSFDVDEMEITGTFHDICYQ
ncbi:sporulation protein YqfC [Anaerolentibacter hominis]|uniref:sporulation protein YqfC n=1 Tax=Anaerolentibacter hominis TaxID=3079009 RepID=UPI0031B896AB